MTGGGGSQQIAALFSIARNEASMRVSVIACLPGLSVRQPNVVKPVRPDRRVIRIY